jgi:hypothetical protein
LGKALVDSRGARPMMEQLKRYPDRELVLFAVRQDNDDVACWDLDQGNVAVVHDFSSPGFERRAEYPGSTPGSAKPSRT